MARRAADLLRSSLNLAPSEADLGSFEPDPLHSAPGLARLRQLLLIPQQVLLTLCQVLLVRSSSAPICSRPSSIRRRPCSHRGRPRSIEPDLAPFAPDLLQSAADPLRSAPGLARLGLFCSDFGRPSSLCRRLSSVGAKPCSFRPRPASIRRRPCTKRSNAIDLCGAFATSCNRSIVLETLVNPNTASVAIGAAVLASLPYGSTRLRSSMTASRTPSSMFLNATSSGSDSSSAFDLASSPQRSLQRDHRPARDALHPHHDPPIEREL